MRTLAKMRRAFQWIQLVLAAVVVVGVWLQVYLIASYFFGAKNALDLHKTIGYTIVHPAELLVFFVAFGAWWRSWGKIGHAFGLAALGTIQVMLTGADEWVGGLHGLLALAVLVMAVQLAKWNADALGLTWRRGGDADTAPPRPLP